MTAQLAPAPVFQGITATGAPLVAGKLFTYAAGTVTPQATYIDSTQTTTNTNPIILNAYGQANVWLNPALAYKFVLQDAAGNPLYTVDNILGALSQPNIVIGPPATGVALRVNGSLDGATALTVFASVPSVQPVAVIESGFPTPGQSFGLLVVGGTNSSDYALKVANSALTTTFLQVNGDGTIVMPASATGGASKLVVNAPVGNSALTVNGTAGVANYAVNVQSPATASQSFGLFISAGTNSSDVALSIANAAQTAPLFTIFGNGGGAMGPGTTSQGIGTMNVLNGYYTNGVKQPIFAAPLAGFGTPTGNVVVNAFPGASASLVQCSNTIAQILITLKAAGIYAT